jgi:DNA modification methylase
VSGQRTDAQRIAALETGIYHGDALNLLTHLPPNSVNLLLTDPPYNTSRANNFHTMGRTGINFIWDGSFDQVTWLQFVDHAIKPGANVVIWNDWKNLGLIAAALEQLGYDIKREIVWYKNNPMPRNITRSMVQRHEHGFWAVKRGARWTFNPSPDRKYEDGVFRYPIPRAPVGRPRHEAKKPDGMFREIVRLLSNPRDRVLDPFVGGGTTPYAAEAEGRRHISFELSVKWYAEAKIHLMEAPAPPAVDQLAQLSE